jgi:hypothetical protein
MSNKEAEPQLESDPLKKIYSQPTLTEYGSVQKLTRSGGATVSDHGGNMMGRG